MLEYKYIHQNYLRNAQPCFGPYYTSFVVALEIEIEKITALESNYYAEEMAEIG